MGTRVSSRQLVGRDQPLGLLMELVQRLFATTVALPTVRLRSHAS